MKRRSRYDLDRQVELAIRRFRRRLKRKKRLAELRRLNERTSGTYVPANHERPVVLRAPRVIEISSEPPRSETLRFLQQVRHYALVQRKRVHIDFANTARLIACGTLLLAAEFHRIKHHSHHVRPLTCNYPSNDKVEQVLQQIGILELLGRTMRTTPTAEDVVHWRFIDGSVAEGEKASHLIDEFRDRLPSTTAKRLYAGIVEAMTNCVNHAYDDVREDSTGIRSDNGWWMFAQERDARLSIVFCDLGIGIPRSLPLKHDKTLLTTLLDRVTGKRRVRDSDAIQAATELGVTRTRRSNQGLGLTDLKQVVDSSKNATLAILSNAGRYSYEKGVDNTIAVAKADFPNSILGTVIIWSLPLVSEIASDVLAT